VRIFHRASGKWRVIAVDESLPCGIRDNKCAHATQPQRAGLLAHIARTGS
jgi:hypothetical protein